MPTNTEIKNVLINILSPEFGLQVFIQYRLIRAAHIQPVEREHKL